jgi:hypothetical protein
MLFKNNNLHYFFSVVAVSAGVEAGAAWVAGAAAGADASTGAGLAGSCFEQAARARTAIIVIAYFILFSLIYE